MIVDATTHNGNVAAALDISSRSVVLGRRYTYAHCGKSAPARSAYQLNLGQEAGDGQVRYRHPHGFEDRQTGSLDGAAQQIG